MSRTIYQLGSYAQKRFMSRQFVATPLSLRKLLRSYTIETTRITIATDGVENQTFLIDAKDGQYVLRVYRQGKKTTSLIEMEVNFMEFLAERGIPVPSVVASKRGQKVSESLHDGATWQYIMMSRITGEHPAIFTESLLREMARLQGRLHLLGTEYAQSHGVQMGRLLSFANRRLNRGWVPLGYSHFDVTPYNLLVHDGHIVGLLDFDDMSFGPLADCLAITLLRSPTIVANPDMRRAYLAEYQSVRPLVRWEQQRVLRHLLFHRRPFSVGLLLKTRSRRKVEI
jgi:Ser/Thr protein kinase RdoA (MazF antagonist)